MKLINLIESIFKINILKLKVSDKNNTYVNYVLSDSAPYKFTNSNSELEIIVEYKADRVLDDYLKKNITDLIALFIEENNKKHSEILLSLETLKSLTNKKDIETIIEKIVEQMFVYKFINAVGIYYLNARLLELRGLFYKSRHNNKNVLFKKEKLEIKKRNILSDIIFFEEIKKITDLNGELFPHSNFGVGLYSNSGPIGILIVSINNQNFHEIQNILKYFSMLLSISFELFSTFKKYQFAINDLKFFKENFFNNSNLINIGKFTATIAHELKNPLVSIGGFTNRALQLSNDERVKNYLNIVKNEVERMESLIKDLLFYTKNLQINLTKVNLLKLVEETVTILYDKLKDESIEVKIDIPKDLTLFLDKNKILQVFLNLLNNSIEAMDGREKTIEIIFNENKNFNILEIKDTGHGIPKDILAKIFTPFFTTKNHGSGLGLPICKKIIEAHKGDIKIESNDKGTTIRIFLPKGGKHE